MTDIQMAKLVGTIANLNAKELEQLAHGLAWYTSGISNKAEKLEFLLNVKVREAKERFEQMDVLRARLKKEAATC